MKQIERFAALLDSPSEQTWLNSIIQLGNELGFELIQISLARKPPQILDEVFLRGNIPVQWLEIYARHQLIRIDPTVSHCVMHSTPLLWRPALFVSTAQKNLCEEAASFGLRSGITLPFHGVNGELGMLCLAKNTRPSTRSLSEILRQSPALALMRDFAFEAGLQFQKPALPQQAPLLTQREIECLKWCATGKSSWEIAQILGCSERTINFHFGNLRRKFHCTTRSQVVVKAIHYGLLTGAAQNKACGSRQELAVE